MATNVILGKANAYIENSNVDSAGDVLLHAENAASIQALILAVSGSATFGGDTGVAASIGVSVAKNLIGWDLEGNSYPNEALAYISDSSVTSGGELTLTATESGTDLFTLSTGLITGLDDASHADVDDEETDGVDEGQIDADGDAAFLETLRTEFGNQGEDLSEDLEVSAITEGSEWLVRDRESGKGYLISLDGSVLRVSKPLIDAAVLAGSMALAGGGTTGVGVSGAGVFAENKVSTHIKTYIDGDGTGGISADTITMKAVDTAEINVCGAGPSLVRWRNGRGIGFDRGFHCTQ